MENVIDDNDYYFSLRGDCQTCGHAAHCGHSCVDETCDHCTECACAHCKQEAERNLGYN